MSVFILNLINNSASELLSIKYCVHFLIKKDPREKWIVKSHGKQFIILYYVFIIKDLTLGILWSNFIIKDLFLNLICFWKAMLILVLNIVSKS